MVQKCEVCLTKFDRKAVTHVAGFPEREYRFCSDRCRDMFLRMEDDELEFYRNPSFSNKESQVGVID